MADKTLEKVEKEYEGQRITDNQDNGTGHGSKGSRSSTSHKNSSKGSSSAGGSTGGPLGRTNKHGK
ncbi:hypothetical protein [Spirosoma litoris]